MLTTLNKTFPLFDYYDTDMTQTVHWNQPAIYSGLANFHKYWGKKPVETLSSIIKNCTEKGDIVVDCFLGGGLVALNALDHNRRFIGIDINPTSTALANFFISLPDYIVYKKAIEKITEAVKSKIEQSYMTENGHIASHLLWKEESIEQVWCNNGGKINRERSTRFDEKQFEKYRDYKIKHIRDIQCFDNTRINSNRDLNFFDFFTPRAVRNIELLLHEFNAFPATIQRALQLTLTSNLGQMSKMVFAISKRGKVAGGKITDKIEVGSWAIGFWRPKTHFEINVWNCFYRRADRLMKILKGSVSANNSSTSNLECFYDNQSDCAIIQDSCLHVLPKIDKGSVSLIVVDPPHGDRIPYLELSELWNAVLSPQIPDFSSEIVVSNAKGRQKNNFRFRKDMKQFFYEANRILHPKHGILAIMFNSANITSWDFIHEETDLIYRGCVPLNYSALSLVQDNRKGALKEDYILFFSKTTDSHENIQSIHGWSKEFPINR